MTKFPKIKQFRDIIKTVRLQHDFQGLDVQGQPIIEHRAPYPTRKFTGTVKLHGTNASIVKQGSTLVVQSRLRELTVADDNAGFAAFVAGLPLEVFAAFTSQNIAIFGEWCGSNIQKGTAINQLPKMFVIFGIKSFEDGRWYNLNEWAFPTDLLNSNQVYVITQFPQYTIKIDFNKPERASEKLAAFTQEVEDMCPVGQYFGIKGVGEGLVWKQNDSIDSSTWFKVKGMKHRISKVRTLAPVDIEKLESVSAFVEMTVTPQRLAQGITIMRERGISIIKESTGEYFRWLVTDILSEELDQLTGNGLCAKDVSGAINRAATPFWFGECDNDMMTNHDRSTI